MTRDDARALIERTVKLSKADEIQVNVTESDERNVRFADNRITTSGSTNDLTVRVFSSFSPGISETFGIRMNCWLLQLSAWQHP